MRVGNGPGARRLVGSVLAPDLCVTEKELLLWCKAVRLFDDMSGEAVHESHVRQTNPAVIGRIFSQREFSVELHAGRGTEVAVLAGNAIGPRLECPGILGGPPVAQVPVAVQTPSRILKSMR